MFFLLVLSVLYCNLRFYSNITQYYDTIHASCSTMPACATRIRNSTTADGRSANMVETNRSKILWGEEACTQYLAIPEISAPFERVFSLAGNICSRRRASLSPDHLDALVFLNANGDLIRE